MPREVRPWPYPTVRSLGAHSAAEVERVLVRLRFAAGRQRDGTAQAQLRARHAGRSTLERLADPEVTLGKLLRCGAVEAQGRLPQTKMTAPVVDEAQAYAGSTARADA